MEGLRLSAQRNAVGQGDGARQFSDFENTTSSRTSENFFLLGIARKPLKRPESDE